MKIPSRLTTLFVLALLLAGCGTQASTANKSRISLGSQAVQATSILLDWYPNSDHAGLYTAMQKGYFSAQHVFPTVRVPSNATGQIELIAAGRADFAITYEADLLAARVRGLPVRSVMCLMQHPLNTVMTLRSSGITRPRQLAGKSVGAAGSPSDKPIVSVMMRHDGASIDQTRMVNVGYGLLSALLTKKVDAVVGVYWTWERIQAEMRGLPVNVMRVERWGMPNYCELVLITNNKVIKNAPSLVRGVVHAMQRGYALAEARPVVGWQALVAGDATLRKQRSLVTRSEVLLRGAVLDAPTIGYQNPGQWRHYASWLATNKLITKGVETVTAYTNEFLAPGIK
jgi:putative hydroxymethylpyrimidine transport system substrate-binding protein